MADTTKVLDMINNASQMVKDAVEKVKMFYVKYQFLTFDPGETPGSDETERFDQTDPSSQNSCG